MISRRAMHLRWIAAALGRFPILPPDLAEKRPGQMAKGDALRKSIDPEGTLFQSKTT